MEKENFWKIQKFFSLGGKMDFSSFNERKWCCLAGFFFISKRKQANSHRARARIKRMDRRCKRRCNVANPDESFSADRRSLRLMRTRARTVQVSLFSF